MTASKRLPDSFGPGMTRRTLLAGASALGLAACGGTLAKRRRAQLPGEAKDVQSGAKIRIGIAAGPVDLDPHTTTGLGDQQLLENIYRGLTVLNPETLSPVGEIAASWVVSSDELTWTFKLRPEVKFHNGRAVVADDVKFSLERILDPKLHASAAADLSPIGAIEVIDSHTVALKLKNRYGILPVALQEPAWSAIIPREAVPNLGTKPVGTGPFQWVSQVPKTSVTLQKFPDYWRKPLPYLAELDYQVIPDASDKLEALLSKQVDFIDSVPLALVAQVANRSGITLVHFRSSWVNELGFNCRVKPFSDVRVRQAIAMALNKNELAKAATYGQGGPAQTMVAPASPIKVNVKPLSYDPVRAKALLAEAGYPNGFSFSFSACGGAEFPDMQLASELIAYQLQAIGINATAPTEAAGVWVDNVITKHSYQGFICGLVSGLDPDQHLYRYFRSDGLYNFSQYASTPTLDRLLLEGRETIDPGQRSKIYSQACQILADQVPWIPLYWLPGLVAMASEVHGFLPEPEFNLRFDTVRIQS
ncbi:MAG: ABC transporter substrate-binding protein [Solirubrobacteraceae bacterium]